jgi:hypothetical protein
VTGLEVIEAEGDGPGDLAHPLCCCLRFGPYALPAASASTRPLP